MTFLLLWRVHRWIRARSPNTLRTAVASALAPSITASNPPRAQAAGDEVGEQGGPRSLFSVSPRRSPTGTFVPSEMTISATTSSAPAKSTPSIINTAASRADRSRPTSSLERPFVAGHEPAGHRRLRLGLSRPRRPVRLRLFCRAASLTRMSRDIADSSGGVGGVVGGVRRGVGRWAGSGGCGRGGGGARAGASWKTVAWGRSMMTVTSQPAHSAADTDAEPVDDGDAVGRSR